MVAIRASAREGVGFGLDPMSALGQKQTCAVQLAMSAFPPIATSIAFFSMSALGQKRTFGTGDGLPSAGAMPEFAWRHVGEGAERTRETCL